MRLSDTAAPVRKALERWGDEMNWEPALGRNRTQAGLQAVSLVTDEESGICVRTVGDVTVAVAVAVTVTMS